MTTNEQKCPVCGEGMRQIKGGFPSQIWFSCWTNNCPLHDNNWRKDYSLEGLKEINTLIQSRIDKAVAAAVKEAIEKNDKSWRSLWPE